MRRRDRSPACDLPAPRAVRPAPPPAMPAAPSAPALRDLLRARTRAAHERVERRLPLPDAVATRGEYRRLLAALLDFHTAVEGGLAAVSGWAAVGVEPADRRKTPWLLADLAALAAGGVAADPAPAARRLAPLALASLGEALGALYVVEGATLGGQVVGPALDARLALGGAAGAYYRAYGARTGLRWREFCRALAAYDDAGGDPEAVVAGACAAFDAYERLVVAPCAPGAARPAAA